MGLVVTQHTRTAALPMCVTPTKHWREIVSAENEWLNSTIMAILLTCRARVSVFSTHLRTICEKRDNVMRPNLVLVLAVENIFYCHFRHLYIYKVVACTENMFVRSSKPISLRTIFVADLDSASLKHLKHAHHVFF
jgi:hypothetical protein